MTTGEGPPLNCNETGQANSDGGKKFLQKSDKPDKLGSGVVSMDLKGLEIKNWQRRPRLNPLTPQE
jgi:hypothetical protein